MVTTTDQTTGARGGEPLRTLARHRNVDTKLIFGQNLIPERPGTLYVGDPLTRGVTRGRVRPSISANGPAIRA